MDRCALFVDAGYVLADGAMAVHGTRHRESVSWDYAGLLQFFGSIARERTGLPLLRCYWYEATVEGRRTSEHDTLADLPGLKLRLGRMKPGRREGVEGEIRRDLATLARNNAISDAILVSAEEDLAQVVADVQDLGIRVGIVHITVGGNWTISRSLRQECDDIIEIGEAHLRPYTDLVAGIQALPAEEQYQLAMSAGRVLTNGHGPVTGPLGSHQALAAGPNPVPPAIYTAPVVAEYQRAAQPMPNAQPPMPAPALPPQAPAQAGPPQAAPPQQLAPQQLPPQAPPSQQLPSQAPPSQQLPSQAMPPPALPAQPLRHSHCRHKHCRHKHCRHKHCRHKHCRHKHCRHKHCRHKHCRHKHCRGASRPRIPRPGRRPLPGRLTARAQPGACGIRWVPRVGLPPAWRTGPPRWAPRASTACTASRRSGSRACPAST